MTELLDRAIARVRALPVEAQDACARVLLDLVPEDGSIYRLTPEEEVDLAEADAEIARGALATDDEVQALWTKHGG